MLSPLDRTKAVQLLASKQANNIANQYNTGLIANILRDGFKGYSTFTDQQLLNGLSSFAKNGDYECQNFLSTIAAEKYLLE